MQHLYKAIRYSRVLISMFYVFSFSSLFLLLFAIIGGDNQISSNKERTRTFLPNRDNNKKVTRQRNKYLKSSLGYLNTHLFTIITDDQCLFFYVSNFFFWLSIITGTSPNSHFDPRIFFTYLRYYHHQERCGHHLCVMAVCLLVDFFFHVNGIIGREKMKR